MTNSPRDRRSVISSAPAAPESVPLLDVHRGNRPLRDEVLHAVAAVYDSGKFLHGPEVEKLEKAVATLSGTSHAVGCASGSDALLLALMALEIGPGDEVIVPSFTFFATASAVWRLGAKIVFADIDPATFNLAPDAFAAAITPATRAVIPVHLYGQCADMTEINCIAERHRVTVIEDAAQAIGASHVGRPAGSMGLMGCLSFYPTKNLGGCGDGGMLTTSDEHLAERLRLLAGHGMKPRYYHRVVGINSRLDTMQAAVLYVKLRWLEHWTSRRIENAARYFELFVDAGLDRQFGLPEPLDRGHVWNQFTIRVPHGRRDALRQHLTAAHIGSEVYYPVPLHQQECFRSLGYGPGDLKETERAAAEVLSLPIFPELTAAEQQLVVRRIGDFFATQRMAA